MVFYFIADINRRSHFAGMGTDVCTESPRGYEIFWKFPQVGTFPTSGCLDKEARITVSALSGSISEASIARFKIIWISQPTDNGLAFPGNK